MGWEVAGCEPLLARCHAVTVASAGCLFSHGGLARPAPLGLPLSSTAVWRPGGAAVELLSTGPALSHHAGCLLSANRLLLVGGWDGKSRTSRVHCLDLQTAAWLPLTEEPGSQAPHGLSGHTATRINDSLICVLGREGGLKIQRKFGDIFLLRLRVGAGGGSYSWSPAPVKTQSRSGHCAILAPSLRDHKLYGLFVLGGRDDQQVHKCGQWPADEVARPGPGIATVEAGLAAAALDKATSAPLALRYHSMTAVTDTCVLVHGGQNFKGRENVSGASSVCLFRAGAAHWYTLHSSTTGPAARRQTVTASIIRHITWYHTQLLPHSIFMLLRTCGQICAWNGDAGGKCLHCGRHQRTSGAGQCHETLLPFLNFQQLTAGYGNNNIVIFVGQQNQSLRRMTNSRGEQITIH